MIGRRTLIGGLGAAAAATVARPFVDAADAQALVNPVDRFQNLEWIDLWPGAAPGAAPALPVEVIKARPATSGVSTLEITGVARPRLMVLRPPRPNGSAALLMPGGGYARLVVAERGPELGRWLVARGWTVFTLLYRLPAEGWAERANVPLQDAQRAIRTIRKHSKAFSINAQRVAAIGFSAGGHLCADLATRYSTPTYAPVDSADSLSARPDFAVPVYAVQTLADPYAHLGSRERLLGASPSPALIKAHSPENNVVAGGPPFLIIHAEDDATVNPENSLRMRSALKAAGVRVETHMFPDGGHGFGIGSVANSTTSAWPELIARGAKSYDLG